MADLASIKMRTFEAVRRLEAALGEPLPPRDRNIPYEEEWNHANFIEFVADVLERRNAEEQQRQKKKGKTPDPVTIN